MATLDQLQRTTAQLNKPDENKENMDIESNTPRQVEAVENPTNSLQPEEEINDVGNQEAQTMQCNQEVGDQVDDSTQNGQPLQMQTHSYGSEYISDIKVSLSKEDERQLNGYKKIDVNLNEGAGGKEVYIWYKRSYFSPITRIQFSFKEEMRKGLEDAMYTEVDKNLNDGAKGNSIYLWFYKGCSEYDGPIENISITTSPVEEKVKFKSSWERLACNLNRRAGGNNIHLWVKRATQTYICDLAATEGFDKDAEMFKKGYIRIDEDTNRGTRGDYVFIWYRLTTEIERAISDMQVSITKEEYEGFKNAGYKLVDQNLNQKTIGPAVHLWYRKDQPITNFNLIVKETDLEKYKNVIRLIKKNLNEGNDGCTEYLWYYHKQEPLRRRAITDIKVSFNEEEERKLLLQGFIAAPHSLNKDDRANQLYLWYKIGIEKPIIRIKFSNDQSTTSYLQELGYEKYEIPNPDSSGDPIYLCYYKGFQDVPFVELDVFNCRQNQFKMLSLGWSYQETFPCKSNAEYTKQIYGRREKQTYISDIRFSAVSETNKHLIQEGYIQEMQNLTNVPGKELYVFYRLTPKKEDALRDLKVSKAKKSMMIIKSKNYQAVEVEGIEEGIVLWSMKDEGDGVIQGFAVEKNQEDKKFYENKEVLRLGSGIAPIYLLKLHGDMSAD